MSWRHKLRNFITNMAPLTAEDRCLIKCLRVEKRWNGRLANDARFFFKENGIVRTFNDLIRKIDRNRLSRPNFRYNSGRFALTGKHSGRWSLQELVCSQDTELRIFLYHEQFPSDFFWILVVLPGCKIGFKIGRNFGTPCTIATVE